MHFPETHHWLRRYLAPGLAALALLAGASVVAQDGAGSGDGQRPSDEPNVLVPDLATEGASKPGPDRRLPPGLDVESLLKGSPVALYDHFGWSDASAPVTNSINANEQKVLQMTELGTSNVFEVDFNRIQPGTIITNLPITINQPGYYYLIQDLTNTSSGEDGIIIDVDDVTIDLMGHTLWGTLRSGISSDDGIFVLGSQTNIKLRNGAVIGWQGDGINALNADFSIWVDLHVRSNGGDGLVTDFNNLIDRVTAYSNGLDGIEGDDGTVIYNCTAAHNADNGIQASQGCTVVNSASFFNDNDGIAVSEGSTIRNCSASDNGVYGFDIAQGVSVTECTAYQNVSNGFDIASSCVLRDCVTSFNGGHGIRTFSDSWVMNNLSHGNGFDGIRISSTDVHVMGNTTTANAASGIRATSSGGLIVRNRSSGNVTNFGFISSTAFGPIVDVKNVGDITAVSDADHPWANIEY